jgi:hypothetical protein
MKRHKFKGRYLPDYIGVSKYEKRNKKKLEHYYGQGLVTLIGFILFAIYKCFF